MVVVICGRRCGIIGVAPYPQYGSTALHHGIWWHPEDGRLPLLNTMEDPSLWPHACSYPRVQRLPLADSGDVPSRSTLIAFQQQPTH